MTRVGGETKCESPFKKTDRYCKIVDKMRWIVHPKSENPNQNKAIQTESQISFKWLHPNFKKKEIHISFGYTIKVF